MPGTLACIVSLQLHCIPRVSCRTTREFCDQDPIIFPPSIILLPRMLRYAQRDVVSLDEMRWVIGRECHKFLDRLPPHTLIKINTQAPVEKNARNSYSQECFSSGEFSHRPCPSLKIVFLLAPLSTVYTLMQSPFKPKLDPSKLM
jgi:hypothetical protein